MTLLIASLLALAAGPLLYRAADRARQALIALDGFIVIAVSGLVVVHIVPHAVDRTTLPQWMMVMSLHSTGEVWRASSHHRSSPDPAQRFVRRR